MRKWRGRQDSHIVWLGLGEPLGGSSRTPSLSRVQDDLHKTKHLNWGWGEERGSGPSKDECKSLCLSIVSDESTQIPSNELGLALLP